MNETHRTAREREREGGERENTTYLGARVTTFKVREREKQDMKEQDERTPHFRAVPVSTVGGS